MAKSFTIPKRLVLDAFQRVKANAGAAGVDNQSLADFERNLKDNLYKIWNRMASGTYFPPPVKAVPIPKKSGESRILGIPTVSDRVAQMVVRMVFEPEVEPHFLPDSYAYRPNKSALQAIGVTRKRCWQYNWALEYDVKRLFDTIPHALLLKAVRKHTQCTWVVLYIQRWLTAPMQQADGSQTKRTMGTPQGGVISPVLANLFLHYVVDQWMQTYHPKTRWCRYADDGLIHCRTRREAEQLLSELTRRFAACGLVLHPDKTRIVYCKDWRRQETHTHTSFDFLGYTFRPRWNRNSETHRMFLGYTPAVSTTAQKAMRIKLRKLALRNRTDLSLEEIAKMVNPVVQGWMNYYSKYNKTEFNKVLRHVNKMLVAWAMRKYKRLSGKRTKASEFLYKIRKDSPELFAHWRQKGMESVFI